MTRLSTDRDAKKYRSWRPRFSVRALAIWVTMICTYFGIWNLTDRYADSIPVSPADEDETRLIIRTSSPMPLVVRQQELLSETNASPGPRFGSSGRKKTRYYVWLLGGTYRLPFESDWEHEPWDGLPHRRSDIDE